MKTATPALLLRLYPLAPPIARLPKEDRAFPAELDYLGIPFPPPP